MKTLAKKLIGYLLQKRIDIISKRKLNKIKKNITNRTRNRSLENEYINLWKQLGKKPSVLFIRLLTTINGIKSIKYVPENIYYGIIEPILNNKAYALIYNDKNFFERYLPKYKTLFPTSILRGINGVIYNADFTHISESQIANILDEFKENESFILKPASDTGGGANVLLVNKLSSGFKVNEEEFRTSDFITFLKYNYRGNFALQHKIIQHSWFKDFNETSLNTVRLYAYRSVKDEEVHPFHAYVRFGMPGSLVDSSSQGGRTCGISQNGILNDFVLGKYGKKYKDLRCIKEKKSTPVPHFKEMKRIAKEIAKSYYYHRLLGFDFCVDENDKVRLMEINTLNIGVINQQMNSGPLFRDFTDEIIDFCNSHKKSVVLDFYV